MTRLVQLQRNAERRLAVVEESKLRLLGKEQDSVFTLALKAIEQSEKLTSLIEQEATSNTLDYDSIYEGQSDWKLILPIDHPVGPANCLVSGTGLTHLGSAKNRNSMHAVSDNETDSMKMFRWGIEGGKPPEGKIGAAPEWFYKGNGTILRAYNEALIKPPFAEGGGEEGEIAGVYLIDGDGCPHRIGMAIGNEFSDHTFEKHNYLNLAGSKMRTCSLGPELVIDPQFDSVSGTVTIERDGKSLWKQKILTGESEMCHSLANIEHHHFKFESHRRPGDLHIHYYGACSLSFSAGIKIADGDVMAVAFENFGRPLRNPLRIELESSEPIKVK